MFNACTSKVAQQPKCFILLPPPTSPIIRHAPTPTHLCTPPPATAPATSPQITNEGQPITFTRRHSASRHTQRPHISTPSVSSNTAKTPLEDLGPQGDPPLEDLTAKWTRYLEQLHTIQTLDKILQLTEQAWPQPPPPPPPPPPPKPGKKNSNKRGVHSKTDKQVSSQGSPQGIPSTANSLLAVVPLGQSVRKPGGPLSSEAVAVVDTLEILGHLLQSVAGEVGSTPSYTDDDDDDLDMDIQGMGQQHVMKHKQVVLTYEQAARCQAVIHRVLIVAIPLLNASALPPKRLASLARAINTLAMASPATNTRQTQPTAAAAAAGFLVIPTPTPTPTPSTQESQHKLSQHKQDFPASLPPPTSTQSPSQVLLTPHTPHTAQLAPYETYPAASTSTDSADAAAHHHPSPAILPSLPFGWSQAYSAAVIRALPFTSPAALCYLLRAVSLDRCKRLLRAAKWLSGPLCERVVAVAAVMTVEQVVVTLSCGAQLVWDPRGDWAQVVLHRLLECTTRTDTTHRTTTAATAPINSISSTSSSLGSKLAPALTPSPLSPASACAALHALGRLSIRPSAPVAALLLRSILGGMMPSYMRMGQGADAGGTGGGATSTENILISAPGSASKVSKGGLTALQLSSTLWSLARLNVPPPQDWMLAYMAATYPMLKARAFTPSQMSMILWAVARLDWAPAPRWLSAYLTGLQQGLPGMTPGELAVVVWACSVVKFRPTKELLYEVAHAAAGLSDTLDARQLSMMATSWARLNFRPDGRTAWKLISRMLDVFDARFGVAPKPDQLLESVSGTAALPTASSSASPLTSTTVEAPSSAAVSASASKVQSKFTHPPEVSKQAVANLCWALHHLGLSRMHKRIAPTLAHAAKACMWEFNLVELSTVGKALAGMAKPVKPHNKRVQQQDTSDTIPDDDDNVDDRAVPTAPPPLSTRSAMQHNNDAKASQTRTRTETQQLQLQQTQAASTPTGGGSGVVVVNEELVQAFLEASQRHMDILLAITNSNRQPTPQQPPTSIPGTDATKAQGIVSVGQAVATGRRLAGSPEQFASLLLAATRLSGGKQPPAYWMMRWYQVTQPSLLAWDKAHLEELCDSVLHMRPPPTPPLAWVRALSEREEQLQQQRGLNAWTRKNLMLTMATFKRAWQAKLMEEQQQQQEQGSGGGTGGGVRRDARAGVRGGGMRGVVQGDGAGAGADVVMGVERQRGGQRWGRWEGGSERGKGQVVG